MVLCSCLCIILRLDVWFGCVFGIGSVFGRSFTPGLVFLLLCVDCFFGGRCFCCYLWLVCLALVICFGTVCFGVDIVCFMVCVGLVCWFAGWC